jgi:hypothetical protein
MSVNDSEASVIVETPTGEKYDINNISGKAKKQLIDAGKIKSDAFVGGPNIPGKVLAKMRAEHAERMAKEEKRKPPAITAGELVKHKGHVREVVEVDNEKNRIAYKKDPKGKKLTWVPFKNVTVVGEDEEEENEEKDE